MSASASGAGLLWPGVPAECSQRADGDGGGGTEGGGSVGGVEEPVASLVRWSSVGMSPPTAAAELSGSAGGPTF